MTISPEPQPSWATLEGVAATRKKEDRMFRHYLTYSLALSFHRFCCSIEIPAQIPKEKRDRLIRSSETLIHHFALAIHTPDRKEESRFLAVALICLRDCQETFDEWLIAPQHEIRAQFITLHGRLEQLVLKAAEAEGGQLRMLG